MAAEQGRMTGTNLRRTLSEPTGEMKKPGKQTPIAPFVMPRQTTKGRHPVLTSGPEGVDHVAIQVTDSPEVHNNNSGPQGYDNEAIPATGSPQVPNNNSGPQGYDNEAIPATGSPQVPNNNSGPQDGNYYNDCKLAALAGLADCATGIAALVYNRPSSDGPVYLVGVGIVLVAGVAEMLAALWVAYDVRNRGAAGRKIMYVSVFMLVLGIVVGIFAYRLKK
ncbi:uncharacterized protein [Triticum aestivum]|uniref:uncharacterized protein isoform X3 n=1 Tax=Triticum aestivum TaxID=4565 RepID=UPI001D028364|nr:uncharacterized protein LOC123111485 isoform X3 [Triticum aestivum]